MSERRNDPHWNFSKSIINEVFPKLNKEEKGTLMRILVRKSREHLTVVTADIRDFHEKFGLEYKGPPRALEPEMSKFRVGFMQEELDEYQSAVYSGDLAGQFDALIDLIYVALGTAYLQGFPFAAGWREVQRANITKERAVSAEQSKRGTAFDVIKPAGWMAPDMDGVLEEHAKKFESNK